MDSVVESRLNVNRRYFFGRAAAGWGRWHWVAAGTGPGGGRGEGGIARAARVTAFRGEGETGDLPVPVGRAVADRFV